jgi:hypothetical protein
MFTILLGFMVLVLFTSPPSSCLSSPFVSLSFVFHNFVAIYAICSLFDLLPSHSFPFTSFFAPPSTSSKVFSRLDVTGNEQCNN